MSAIDASCYAIQPEKDSGDGEINRYKPHPCESSDSSHMIVSEIMNDIVDNVFEVIMSKSIQQTPKTEKISPNVVGDILDNILSPPQNDLTNETYLHDETSLLDDEIKRIIKEMKYPPEQKTIICTQGVGDQDQSAAPDKVLAEPAKRTTLERKNRLTNLVRNSKQMLARFVASEESEVKLPKSEEENEEVVKVIDLQGEDNENVGETSGGNPEVGIMQMLSDSTMDMVDLDSSIKKGDKSVEEDEKEVNEEKELASCSLAKVEDNKKNVVVKKKWNLGSKIMKYLKRHSRKE